MVVRGYLPDSKDIYNDLTVTMVLAGGISAGTYSLGEANGDVTAVVESGFGPYSSNVSGSVTLDFVNHRWINGSFEFAGENANAEAMGMAGALEALGTFHQIPFTPGQEHDVRISGAVVENLEGSSVMRIGSDFSMAFIGVDIRLTMQFNADPAAETYDVTADDLPSRWHLRGLKPRPSAAR
ncbi:MAG: hypothetical protein M5R40_14900 [Anaerolineae bacterium]|nr:hypothetical protein [Anaerolineae bacterium]